MGILTAALIAAVMWQNLDARHALNKTNHDASLRDGAEFLAGIPALIAVADAKSPESLKFHDLKNWLEEHRESDYQIIVAFEGRVTGKDWDAFNAAYVGQDWERWPFPCYQGPLFETEKKREAFPWYYVVSPTGEVIESTGEIWKAQKALEDVFAAMPKRDPLFGYAKPALLKDEIATAASKAPTRAQLLKTLAAFAAKGAKAAPEKAAEAEALAAGAKQARELELRDAYSRYWAGPSKSLAAVAELERQWGVAVKNDWRVLEMKKWSAEHPAHQKLLKLQLEADAVLALPAGKPADAKARGQKIAALKAKLKKFVNDADETVSKDAIRISQML